MSTPNRSPARLLESEATAPPLLQLEFVNVLRTGCRRGSIPIQKAHESVDWLGQSVVFETRRGWLLKVAWVAELLTGFAVVENRRFCDFRHLAVTDQAKHL